MRSREATAVLVAVGLMLALASPAVARHSSVAALQVALRALHLYRGGIDGIAGPQTRGAVRSLQRRKGLPVDGVVGPRTRRALGRRGRPALGSRTLARGKRGWDVAALQYLLSTRGFSPGSIDGGYGDQTRAAVARFQRAAGIGADGIAGPATLRALRSPRQSPSVGGPFSLLRPVGARIGDGFGWISGRRHTGVDLEAAFGTPVGAAGRGVVRFAGWNSGGYGNLVVVGHRLGYETWYAHLSRISASVGQAVVGGTGIGYVGSTGRSTGPHLHFEVRHAGIPVDPVPLLGTVAARSSASRQRCLEGGARARRPDRRDLIAADDPALAELAACR